MFLKGERNSRAIRRANENKAPTRYGVTRNKSRVSTGSDNSSNGTRESSATSNTGYRTSLEEITSQYINHDSSSRNMYSEPSLEATRTLSPMETVQDQFETAELSASTAEVPRRPLSPRSEMNTFRIENPVPSPPVRGPPGPMGRFFSQGGGLTDLEGQQVDELKRMFSLRSEALRLRSKLRTTRKELHVKQEAKDFADDAFMKFVREIRVRASRHTSLGSQLVTDPVLDQHYASMEAARNAYGPSEDEYNALEDVLDETEFELARAEGRLYNTRVHSDSVPEPTPPNTVQEVIQSPIWGLSSEVPRQYHPLQVTYLSRLGDLDLARERYHNMIQEQTNLVSIQESRLPLGIELHDNEKTFLEGFSEQKGALEAEIAEIEADVDRLREKCLAEGIDIAESSDESVDGDNI